MISSAQQLLPSKSHVQGHTNKRALNLLCSHSWIACCFCFSNSKCLPLNQDRSKVSEKRSKRQMDMAPESHEAWPGTSLLMYYCISSWGICIFINISAPAHAWWDRCQPIRRATVQTDLVTELRFIIYLLNLILPHPHRQVSSILTLQCHNQEVSKVVNFVPRRIVNSPWCNAVENPRRWRAPQQNNIRFPT